MGWARPLLCMCLLNYWTGMTLVSFSIHRTNQAMMEMVIFSSRPALNLMMKSGRECLVDWLKWRGESFLSLSDMNSSGFQSLQFSFMQLFCFDFWNHLTSCIKCIRNISSEHARLLQRLVILFFNYYIFEKCKAAVVALKQRLGCSVHVRNDPFPSAVL